MIDKDRCFYGYKHWTLEEETRRRKSEAARRQWQDPEIRRKRLEARSKKK